MPNTGANAGERLGFAGRSRVVFRHRPGVAQYPALDHYDSAMKRLCSFIILIAGFVALVPLLAIGQPGPEESTNTWAKAEAAIEGYLKGIDPKMRFAEFRSERLRKYLPDFHVFVRFD